MYDTQQKSIHITFRGHRNVTYTGTLLLLRNWTSSNFSKSGRTDNDTTVGTEEDTYDNLGASYYVIAVVLVYGMSIVMLIASHIKRRVDKVVEDKQIDRYLQDFQIVKERHARDSYKNLKRAIMKKINWERQRKPTYHNLQKSIVPLIAIGIPGVETLSDIDAQSVSSLSNVDLAAAEQYMIAKDKGKVYPGKKTVNDATAAYFAAAKRFSRDQSPHTLARMFRERKLSRDHGLYGVPSGYLDPKTSVYYSHRSKTSSCGDSDILEEEDEPGTSDLTHLHQSQEGRKGDTTNTDGDGKMVNFLITSQSVPKSQTREIKVEINKESHMPARTSSVAVIPQPSPKRELLVPLPRYNDPSESRGNKSPSPIDALKVSPGYIFGRSSGSVPGYAIPVNRRSSSRLSSSPSSSFLNDGSREELIHITCL